MNEASSSQQSILSVGDAVERNSDPRTLVSTPKTGILITNHLNLMYMLAAGLLMPPSGFGGKYYGDTLAAFPGWLPVFVGRGRKVAQAPRAALAHSAAEADYLKPVILEIGLEGLRGPAQAHGDGEWAERLLEQGIADEERLLLVPAPLPISRIHRILFRSEAEQEEVTSAVADRGNVTLAAINKKPVKTRFAGDRTRSWPPAGGPTERDVALGPSQAAGGVMAVLHQLANAGELSLRACSAAFDPSLDPPDDSILGALPEWVRGGTAAERGGPFRTGRELFWSVVDGLVERRFKADGRRAEDVLIDVLKESAEGMGGDLQDRAAELVTTLESLGGGLGGGTVSEMLRQHRTPLARAAILFFLRQRSSALLELIEDYPQLEERDRLAAAILFGVRDGWLKLPLDLRGRPELREAVTHRMAALVHRLDKSGFDLGEAPPRVRPLRELFGDPAQWDVKTEKAAVRLARGLKWNCIRTTVSLGRGSYEFRVEGGSAHIDFEGEPKVVTRVDRKRFLEALAAERIDSRLDQAVRRNLGG